MQGGLLVRGVGWGVIARMMKSEKFVTFFYLFPQTAVKIRFD